jgi:hypothetical protein
VKMTKERWVYAAVLGVGLLALIVDRAMLSPAGASASTDLTPATDTPDLAAPPSDAEPAPSVPAAPPLAKRLEPDTPNWQLKIRDGFKAAESWLPAQQLTQEPETAAPDESEAFGTSHTLSAIHGHGTAVAVVVVNGKMLKLGQEIDGWTLTEIADLSAVFMQKEARVELSLKVPTVPGSVGKKPPAPGNP